MSRTPIASQQVRLYRDLVGKKYQDFDCAQLAREVLLRAFGVSAPPGAIPGIGEVAAFDDVAKVMHAFWERIGDRAGSAERVGDVILSYPEPYRPHLSVLVRTGSAKLAITSTRRAGVVTIKPGYVANVWGAYRPRWA
jgi:hypothetical protein